MNEDTKPSGSVKFVDTTIRDGQASLWAMNMRTRHMLPAMPYLDSAGFDSMEFFATGSRLKKFVRHLGENPWHWLREGAAAATYTPLRWHGSAAGSSMSGNIPPEVGDLMLEKAASLGISLTRTGNNWNDYSDMGELLARLRRFGLKSVINIIYSVSPRHTDEYFVRKVQELAQLQPFRICFKDVGGLLTPERTRALLPKIMAEATDVEWEFHGHCNNGLGPLNAIEAAKCGVRYIHTAIPPLANGSSQPSIYTVAANLRDLGFDADIDEEALRPVTEHFGKIAEVEGFPVGSPVEYEERQYRHQIPGGMISNLEYQLAQAGCDGRMDEVLEETARVRKDFGYPIMVTPLSQFVGTQAAINIIVGERYRQVSDRTIEYALGQHGGQEAIEAMDADVRDRILARPRAAELAGEGTPPPTLAELRKRYGPDVCDEDLILRSIVGDDAVDVVGSADTPRVDWADERPIVSLVRALVEASEHEQIELTRGDVGLRLRRTVASP